VADAFQAFEVSGTLAVNLPEKARLALRVGAAADALGGLVAFYGHCSDGFFSSAGLVTSVPSKIASVRDACVSRGPCRLATTAPVTGNTIMTELVLSVLIHWHEVEGDNKKVDELMALLTHKTLEIYQARNCLGSYSFAGPERFSELPSEAAVENYAPTKKGDYSLLKQYHLSLEGGFGKITSSGAFGLVCSNSLIAAYLAEMHACSSHSDIVSQAAYAAFAGAVSGALWKGMTVPALIDLMITIAAGVSCEHSRAEAAQWRRSKKHWPRWRLNRVKAPYTASQRIDDARRDVLKGLPLEKILQKYGGGCGEPDLVAGVMAVALYAFEQKWTVKQAVLAVVNADALCSGIDRNAIASAVGQLLTAAGHPIGFGEQELSFVERDDMRKNGLWKDLYATIAS